MNPLDRSQTPLSSPQDVQESAQSSSPAQDAEGVLQANIANVNAASAEQPETLPAHFYKLPASTSPSNVVEALSQNPASVPAPQGAASTLSDLVNVQEKAHFDLLEGLIVPVFNYALTIKYIHVADRQSLHNFLKKIFITLEGKDYSYDQASFITDLLMPTDGKYNKNQNRAELMKIVNSYIPDLYGRKYLNVDWNITWPLVELVRQGQKPTDSTTIVDDEVKIKVYERYEELRLAAIKSGTDRALASKITYIQAAFAYCVGVGAVKRWVSDGRLKKNAELAREQAQALTPVLTPENLADDEQVPGPSRAARSSASLRFEPYQIPERVQARARALGLSAEALQGIHIGVAPTSEFNAQMAALPWPVVTTDHFVQEGTRRVINSVKRREIGQFIIERCPPDDRAYVFVASRYGVSVQDVFRWASEASE